MEVDNDDRMVNFFFRDSRCLVDYQHFGDVLSFDTTYQTNRYSLICAPFVGINHHNENVLFGIAFMSSETESSFEWLFRVFLESMGGKQPETIFTDQCRAMMNAIQTVFPLSHHRLCQWHINQNYTSHFGNLKSEWDVKGLWKKCMNHCECEEEFESTWKELMERLDIYEVDKEWFEGMYGLRHLWATCFSNEVFCARLHATSRSESTNAALKSIFGNKTSYLLDCVLGYEKLQDNWRVNEKKNDTLCRHNMPTPVVPHNPLLKQAANVYTFNIFKLFEKELQDTMGFEYPQPFTCEGSTLLFFKVKSYSEGSRFKLVEYDSENLEVKCSCHKFETGGVLCSHILKVLDVLKMHIIPEKYIKKRWTKVARGGVCDEHSTLRSVKSGNGGSYVNEMAFVNNVTKEVHDIAMQGKANVEVRDIIIEGIESIKGRINVLSKKGNLKDSMAADNLVRAEDCTNLDEVIVREPITAKSRGVTNVFKRHWDDKRKKRKGKGKAEGSKRAAKVVKRSQDSQTLRDGCTSQEATFAQQVQWSQNQMYFGTMGSITSQMNGNLSMFGFDMSQEHSNRDWSLP